MQVGVCGRNEENGYFIIKGALFLEMIKHSERYFTLYLTAVDRKVYCEEDRGGRSKLGADREKRWALSTSVPPSWNGPPLLYSGPDGRVLVQMMMSDKSRMMVSSIADPVDRRKFVAKYATCPPGLNDDRISTPPPPLTKAFPYAYGQTIPVVHFTKEGHLSVKDIFGGINQTANVK